MNEKLLIPPSVRRRQREREKQDGRKAKPLESQKKAKIAMLMAQSPDGVRLKDIEEAIGVSNWAATNHITKITKELRGSQFIVDRWRDGQFMRYRIIRREQ